MRVLYASCRYDPLDRDEGSGIDFNVYEALRNEGVELVIAGPFKDRPSKLEQLYHSFHRLFSKKLHAKFSTAYLKYSAKEIKKAIDENKPDAMFTHNLIPLVYLKTSIPIVYKTDSILQNMFEQWPTYSWLEYRRMLKWEKAALQVSNRVITASKWAEEALTGHYRIPSEHIFVMVNPSSLPEETIPASIETKNISRNEVNLLLVGKDYQRKGIDIAIKVVELLQHIGINAHLRIAGQSQPDSEHVSFMGLYKKEIPEQLEAYVSNYQWAHFLIHPARYEAAGIVCAEAAAFGVPTITNAIGGLATTVQDGVSGVVLPALSPAEEYEKVVEYFLQNPDEYLALRRSTRERYEKELNWEAAGKRIVEILQSVVNEKQKGIPQ